VRYVDLDEVIHLTLAHARDCPCRGCGLLRAAALAPLSNFTREEAMPHDQDDPRPLPYKGLEVGR
jgi:hypothetical protein